MALLTDRRREVDFKDTLLEAAHIAGPLPGHRNKCNLEQVTIGATKNSEHLHFVDFCLTSEKRLRMRLVQRSIRRRRRRNEKNEQQNLSLSFALHFDWITRDSAIVSKCFSVYTQSEEDSKLFLSEY